MKFKKEEIGESLFEGAIEIILTVILCAVGWLVCRGFGSVFGSELSELDFDSYALIGIIALVVIALIVGSVIGSLKKRKKKE